MPLSSGKAGFEYKEPTLEELNRGFEQVSQNGTALTIWGRQPPSPEVIAAAAKSPSYSLETWQKYAENTQKYAPIIQEAQERGGYTIGQKLSGEAGQAMALEAGYPGLVTNVMPVSGIPVGAGAVGAIAAKLAGAVSKTGSIVPVASGIATGIGGGGWSALLGALGLGSTATALISQFLPGGTISKIGGKNMTMTTGSSVDVASGGLLQEGFMGIGVPEPPAAMVSKAWKTKSFSNTAGEYWVYHWILVDGRRVTWNEAKKQAKIWRPRKNIVLGYKPRVKDLIRANKHINRLNKSVKKQLAKSGFDFKK